MTFKVISTGSQGNAVVINDRILVDCGVPFKLIRPVAGRLQLVFLTHKHKDHFLPATIRRLAKERPGLRWCCCDWMIPLLAHAGVDKHQIDVFPLLSPMAIPGIVARAEAVPLHHDVENAGWKLTVDGETVFYATDTGTLNHIKCPDFDFYLIEANHTEAEIEQRIAEKHAAGQFAYESRARANHLSREQAEKWLAENAGPNSQFMFLHQHRDKEAEHGET